MDNQVAPVATAPMPPWSVIQTDITGEDFVGILSELGLRGSLVKTRHWDYQRVFIKDEQGVSLGRACVYRGFYSHVKWYLDDRGNKPAIRLSVRMQTGRVPTEEEWEVAFARSKAAAQEKYEAKMQWRRDHPKKRKALAKPNLYSTIVPDLLIEMQKNDDLKGPQPCPKKASKKRN